ncbi:MAG TPA: hypothetical protein VFJ85_18740 [Acidimicrobiales bacterium]|nr:hypothetical protein [Acidimicrobiales bacterium]
MAQPEFVPLHAGDRVRPAERIPRHPGWRQTRPAELVDPGVPTGQRFGTPGPDQGYALTLAQRFVERLELGPDEHDEDAVAGCLGVALRRASLFGRAPVVHDLDLAFTLFGYLGGAPADLVTWRTAKLRGAAHDYWVQRDAADAVPEATLRLTPAQVRDRLTDWTSLVSRK